MGIYRFYKKKEDLEGYSSSPSELGSVKTQRLLNNCDIVYKVLGGKEENHTEGLKMAKFK